MPENDFGDVIECNTYLEAILHLSMLFDMAEALTIPQNAFEAVLDCNAYLLTGFITKLKVQIVRVVHK